VTRFFFLLLASIVLGTACLLWVNSHAARAGQSYWGRGLGGMPAYPPPGVDTGWLRPDQGKDWASPAGDALRLPLDTGSVDNILLLTPDGLYCYTLTTALRLPGADSTAAGEPQAPQAVYLFAPAPALGLPTGKVPPEARAMPCFPGCPSGSGTSLLLLPGGCLPWTAQP
jgi:hypothetical protein